MYTLFFLLRENTPSSIMAEVVIKQRNYLKHCFSMTLTKETSGTCYSASQITQSSEFLKN